jgi:hypothetical protein
VAPKSEKSQDFYRWVDADGRLHVVSSLDAVPAAERSRAEHVRLDGAAALGSVPSPSVAAATWQPDPASFALGIGAALVFGLLFRLLPGGWRAITRVAVVLGIGALLTGLYLGSIRRAAGVSGAGALASPRALIDDAKAAVQKLDARHEQQEEELRKIEAEAH